MKKQKRVMTILLAVNLALAATACRKVALPGQSERVSRATSIETASLLTQEGSAETTSSHTQDSVHMSEPGENRSEILDVGHTEEMVNTVPVPQVPVESEAPAQQPVSTAPTGFEKDENGNILSPDGRRGSELDTPYRKNGVILVNKQHHVSSNYVPVTTDSGPIVAIEAATPLAMLIEAAAEEGIYITADSNYRSYDTQSAIIRREASGDGEAEANKLTAYPRQSEHQTGLAVDFTDDNNGWASYSSDFGDLDAGRWLAANSYKYGFILCYLKGKEAITGYNYEPWHFRYVGTEISYAIGPNPTLTLEEFLGE